MINYEEIIENLEDDKVAGLLEQLGAHVIDKPDYLMASTICHNEDANEASNKLYYYKNTHLFYCFTSCGPMSIFTFLKNYYETREIAYDWYTDILEVAQNCSLKRNFHSYSSYKKIRDKYNSSQSYQLPTYNSSILNVFEDIYPREWIDDNISIPTMQKFQIKFSPTQNKIIIPHFNLNHELIGIRGRALDEWEVENVGKYAPVWIENKCYSHPLSLNLYGFDKNFENIKRRQVAYIFESEKAVMQLDSMGIENLGVAICGSNFNKFQLKLLMRAQPREIILCLDNEEKDKEHIYFDHLYKICKKYSLYSQMSFIYDMNHLTKAKDSPTDCGKDIFLKLLERRIVVK